MKMIKMILWKQAVNEGEFRKRSHARSLRLRSATVFICCLLSFILHIFLSLHLAGLHGTGALMRNMMFFVYKNKNVSGSRPQFRTDIRNEPPYNNSFTIQLSRSNRSGFVGIFITLTNNLTTTSYKGTRNCMNNNLIIEYVPIGDIKPYERNAKLHE